MAQTERDTSTIIGLLQDNNAGDISPEDLRDALVSLNGGYGSMIMTNQTTMPFTVGPTPAILDVYNFITSRSADINVNGIEVELNPTYSIRVNSTGLYQIVYYASFSSGTDVEIQLSPYRNGINAGIEGRQDCKANESVFHAANAIIPLDAGDYIDIRFNTFGPSATLTFYGSSFQISRVG